MRKDLFVWLLVCLLQCDYLQARPVVLTYKERFKQFLRKVIYGITPTTVYTTLKPQKFPEEYEPIQMLEWQLKEELLRGITTPDWEPKLTDKTELWDGYFLDPTFDDITFHCMRHLHVNDTRPETMKYYWETTFGPGKSVEEFAKYWKERALKTNSDWWATYKTTKKIAVEDMTYDSVEKVKWVTNFGDSHIDSEDRRMITEEQRRVDKEYEKNQAMFRYKPGDETMVHHHTVPAETTPPAKKPASVTTAAHATANVPETETFPEGGPESLKCTTDEPYIEEH